MRKSTVLFGKIIRSATRLHGGGSAFPGLVVEKIDPGFLKQALSNLPHGVVVISGTNGKTTTTKMLVELLESHGLKVFTNRTGSNFTRGIVSALLGEIHHFKLDVDVAVLELDEAHAVQFVKQVRPTYSVLLNVLRDQLDRFGEIDKTAQLLAAVAQKTTSGVLLNRDDPLIANIAKDNLSAPVRFFGYTAKLADKFPSDDELHGPKNSKRTTTKTDVELISFNEKTAVYKIDGTEKKTSLQLNGAHNILNGAAALAAARMILGKMVDNANLLKALAEVKPAFGRGENIKINGQNLELILVKNPSGFRLALASQLDNNADVMIAINDQYADGRDMSWLWDVDFTTLKNVSVVGGVRAYDMALRLQYDQVKFGLVKPDLKQALKVLLDLPDNKPKQIFCTYTAMLQLRKIVGKSADIEEAL